MNLAVSDNKNPVDKAFEESVRVDVPGDAAAIVVVGSGPVGMHFVAELCKRDVESPVILYGAEPWAPYDRIKLSSYLAGDIDRNALDLPDINFCLSMVETRYNCPVTSIDRDRKLIIDAEGREQHYSHLVLAVGSHPFVPKIQNIDIPGVYTFRSLSEADRLFARTARSKHTVVLGGGLLGLETARAMQRLNTSITMVEHNRWLMLQQLDERGGEILKSRVEELGIRVILNDSVQEALGNQRLEAVKLRCGRVLDCDTLVIAAGIRANLDLASDARLVAQKGIQIDDTLTTSDSCIHAIGECAEHEQQTYGLVKPGFEMASVLADRLTGGDSLYRGSTDSSRLKVMNQKVFSAGRTGSADQETSAVKEYVYESPKEGIYRKIRVHRDRLIGAIAIGDWHESALLEDAITQQRKVWLWHLVNFRRNGYVWCDEADMEVSAWPASAVVCNCTGVTRGQLSAAMAQGCSAVKCLSDNTRAGTVCGSCKPVLAELVGESANRSAVRGWRSTLIASLLTVLIAVVFVSGFSIPYQDTVQVQFNWDQLWRDGFIKQVTGFSLLGIAVVGMLLSLRKRINWLQFGDYNLWRIAHIVLGVLAMTVLIAHTGFRIGDQLNLLLMLDFLLLAGIGALASMIISTEHLQSVAVAKRQRARWTWIHILLVWPLPVLLGAHVLKTYYY